MKQSLRMALGAITASLSVALMCVIALIPYVTYALPAAAGILITVIVIEINKKWALGVYGVVSVLSLLLVPDKEVALLYVAFFGYYPILKAIFEQKLSKGISLLMKFLVFNISIILCYLLLIFIFKIDLSDISTLGKYAYPILLGMGNVTFFIFDFALTQLITVYLRRWQRYVRKMFRIK